MSGSSPFFFMYRCLFEVLGLIPPLSSFQCALLEYLNVAPSQLHPNSWAMVRAFEIGCVSLNNVSKKLFEFNSNVFRRLKDHFFKVLATDVVVDGFAQLFNRDREPHFPLYWHLDPTKFKSFAEDLLTLVEPTGGTMPPSVDPPFGEGDQPTVRVDPNDDEVVEVSPNEVSASPTVVVTALISLVGLVVAPLSTIVTSLLSVGVTITSAPKMLHLSSSAPSILPSIVLTSALPSSFSHPNVSLCHMYTSCNSNSLWEVEVAKWRVAARTFWRVKRLKVANATIAFTEVVKSNHQLSSKREKNDLIGKVESIAVEKDEFTKVVAELEAHLKDSESRLEEFELKASKEMEANKELEEELLTGCQPITRDSVSLAHSKPSFPEQQPPFSCIPLLTMSLMPNSRVPLLLFISSIFFTSFPGLTFGAIVSLRSIEIFKTHEWLKATTTVYFLCKGENETVLPDVKKPHAIYAFNGQESWQPLSSFSSKKCKRCGFYEEDSITSDDAFDEWEFCPSDFAAPNGEYIRFKEKEFNATFLCPECLSLAGVDEHDDGKGMHIAVVVLLSILVSVTLILGVVGAYKFWRKKLREQDQARLLKLFEDDDDIGDELGLGSAI
ncbi:hypothetical protein D0Y65_036602 [Glycine soja]|nr:hypothetical protein D0Y65_036602 [Glycine soja]